MIQKLIGYLSFTLLFSCAVCAQTFSTASMTLKKVKSLDDISDLKIENPDWTIYADYFTVRDSLYFPEIFQAKMNEVLIMEGKLDGRKFATKKMAYADLELCRVSYIYLDERAVTKEQVDSLRLLILKRYAEGESFINLVKEYTMDSNPTGDLGWFHEGMMVDEFDRVCRTKSKGDIFTVDITDKGWYYIVLKTYDNIISSAVVGLNINCVGH